jgi:hypothetical protein
MRIEDGPLTYAEARQTFEGELQHYLEGGKLLLLSASLRMI